MKVFDIMSEHIVTVGLSEPVTAAARLLKQHNIGAVPVCDDRGQIRGMITDRDIAVRCVATGVSPRRGEGGRYHDPWGHNRKRHGICRRGRSAYGRCTGAAFAGLP